MACRFWSASPPVVEISQIGRQSTISQTPIVVSSINAVEANPNRKRKVRFYLSSYRFGSRAKQVLSDIDENKPVAIIPNALDFSDDLERKNHSLDREIEDLQLFGLSSQILDLRLWFQRKEELGRELKKFSMVWVVGGNTFILRQAFHQSGFDDLLRTSIDESVLYAGYSAGACVITPTLRGIHLADEPDIHPDGYPEEVLWDGVNLIPYCIVPHYESDHAESPAMNSVVQYYLENKIPFVVLSDGEDMII